MLSLAPPPAKAKFLGLMTAGLASAFALAAPSHAVTLQSGFAGDYAPANWTLTTSRYQIGSGTVVTTGAPSSIMLNANGPSHEADFTKYTTTATAAGPVSFSWNFSQTERLESFLYYILNGSRTLISFDSALHNAGTTSFAVADGDTFGFNLQLDSGHNTSSATATISNFSAPIPSSTIATASATSSVPGPLPILGLAAAFGFSRKLRKRIKLHRGTSDISVSTGA